MGAKPFSQFLESIDVLSTRPSEARLTQLAEAARFCDGVYRGSIPVFRLKEAMSTSDFPLLFGDILDVQMQATYAETPQSFESWAKVITVPDFRNVSRREVLGGDGTLDHVDELGEYTARAIGESDQTYRVRKYGNTMPFSWETLVNDDVNFIKDQPERFGRGARRTEEKLATELIVESGKWKSSFISTDKGNLITDKLTIEGLTAALQKFAVQYDYEGEPILNTPNVLLITPGLEIQARNILNALEITYSDVSDPTNAVEMRVGNWIKAGLKLEIGYYIPTVGGPDMSNAWALFSKQERAAVEVARLRGHEKPELFMKAPDAVYVAGGTVGPTDGTFQFDAVEYKIRHVFGGMALDPKLVVASTGTGA